MTKLTDEIYQFLWDWLKLAELGQKRIEAGEILVEPKIQIKKITATGNVLFYFNTDFNNIKARQVHRPVTQVFTTCLTTVLLDKAVMLFGL